MNQFQKSVVFGLGLVSILYILWLPPSPTKPASATSTGPINDSKSISQTIHEDLEIIVDRKDVFPSFAEVKIEDYSNYNPETITVTLEKNIPITFTRTKTFFNHDRRIWVGRNPESPLSFYVSTGYKDLYTANVELVEANYTLFIKGGQVTKTEHAADINCRTQLEAAGSPIDKPITTNTFQNLSAASTAPITIDLSLFITEDLVEKHGYDKVFNQCLTDIESCNQLVENSLITNFRWYVLDFVTIPKELYGFSGFMNNDLPFMSDEKSKLGKFVHDTMTASGSDQAMTLVPSPGDWGGLAWVGGEQSMALYDGGYSVKAHEMGHNLGALHDRTTAKAETTNPSYCFGYMAKDQMLFINNGEKKYYDIYVGDNMSYASIKAPMYANPNINYTYTSLSEIPRINKTIVLGVPLTEAFPCYAAKTISERAPTLAAKRKRVASTIIISPIDTAIQAGKSATFSTSNLKNTSYQWQKNGVDITGATNNTLTINNATSLDSGSYTCVLNANGEIISTKPAKLKIDPLSQYNPAAKLLNISTRSLVRTGDAVQIAGFVLSGNQNADVLIRAAGPSLSAWKLNPLLHDPKVSIYNNTPKLIATAKNWDYNQIQNLAHNLGAFDWPQGSGDTAKLQTLSCTSNSVIVESASNAEGIGLVEVYDTNKHFSGPRLINISTRSWVGTGDNVQIAGFVIGGSGLKTLLIRAIGPSLPVVGLNTSLSDPTLTLYNEGKAVATNDNWSEEDFTTIKSINAEVGAFKFIKDNSKDAAMLITLPAGAYSVIVVPKEGTPTGIGMVEIYEYR